MLALPSAPSTARRLPLAVPARRHLPLSPHARPADRTRPRYAVWEVTLRCDLACNHCSSRAGRARPDELTTAEALGLVDQMADLGVLEVTLIGGEAYLRDDWTDIVRAIRRRGMECTMVTGGRALTLGAAARAAKDAGLPERVGVHRLGLEDTHDALRGVKGQPAASALAGLANLAAAGVQVSANTQIGRKNRRELPPLFDLLRDDRSALLAAAAHRGGRDRVADQPDLLLEPYHPIEVMPQVMRVKERADAADVRLWPGNNLGYYGPVRVGPPAATSRPGASARSCGAGAVHPRHRIERIDQGLSVAPERRVRGRQRPDDDRLRDIWERSEPLRFTRERTTDELWGYCKGCYYAEDCLGGCSWTAHSLLGKRGNNPFCHHRALDLLSRGTAPRAGRAGRSPGGDAVRPRAFRGDPGGLARRGAGPRARGRGGCRGLALFIERRCAVERRMDDGCFRSLCRMCSPHQEGWSRRVPSATRRPTRPALRRLAARFRGSAGPRGWHDDPGVEPWLRRGLRGATIGDPPKGNHATGESAEQEVAGRQ